RSWRDGPSHRRTAGPPANRGVRSPVRRRASSCLPLILADRLVTIVGPGGIGKTRLAIEVSRNLRSTFHDGVHFADMAKVADGDLVWPTLAASLGLVASDSRSVQSLLSQVRSKQLLILID